MGCSFSLHLHFSQNLVFRPINSSFLLDITMSEHFSHPIFVIQNPHRLRPFYIAPTCVRAEITRKKVRFNSILFDFDGKKKNLKPTVCKSMLDYCIKPDCLWCDQWLLYTCCRPVHIHHSEMHHCPFCKWENEFIQFGYFIYNLKFPISLLSQVLCYSFALFSFIESTSSVPFDFGHKIRFRHLIFVILQQTIFRSIYGNVSNDSLRCYLPLKTTVDL